MKALLAAKCSPVLGKPNVPVPVAGSSICTLCTSCSIFFTLSVNYPLELPLSASPCGATFLSTDAKFYAGQNA